MNIRVNGKDVNINTSNGQATVENLLAYLKIKSRVVVEKNGVIINNECYRSEEICDGDVLEIVQFVGGG